MEGGFIFLGAGLCPRCGFRQFIWRYGPHVLCSTCRKELNMGKQRVVRITESHIFITDAMPEDDAKAIALHYIEDARSTDVLRVEGSPKSGLLPILERHHP